MEVALEAESSLSQAGSGRWGRGSEVGALRGGTQGRSSSEGPGRGESDPGQREGIRRLSRSREERGDQL